MSKKITIRCSQLIHYNQDIEVTEQEYKLLKEFEGMDAEMSDIETREAYLLLCNKIDTSDIIDADERFEGILIDDL